MFCISQVLTLAKKIRAKWGDFNATDSDESDTPNWGFLNLKKLGHIALGIAKEELRDLPIRGIEDAIDVLGQQKDWDRGQVLMGVRFNSVILAASSVEKCLLWKMTLILIVNNVTLKDFIHRL